MKASFTLGQQKALAFAPKPTSALSFFSSLYLVYKVLSSPNKRKKVYHRLVLAMSLINVVDSSFHFWGTWAIPEGTPFTYAAAGTASTCKAQGFMITLGWARAGYYASLSSFAFLAVRNNFKEVNMVKVEPWFHLASNVLPVTCAIVAVVRDHIAPGSSWCDIVGDYPLGCQGNDDLPCQTGAGASKNSLIVAVFVLFVLVFATLMMVLLYMLARQRENRNANLMGKAKFLETARRQKSNIVARQASLYLAAFYASFSFEFVEEIIEWTTGGVYFPIRIIANVMTTLQGFFNMLVFNHLHLKKERTEDRNAIKRGMSGLSKVLTCKCQKDLPPTPSTDSAVEDSQTFPETKVIPQKHKFSIFEGTNASSGSPWAQFLNEESEEEQKADNDGLAEQEGFTDNHDTGYDLDNQGSVEPEVDSVAVNSGIDEGAEENV